MLRRAFGDPVRGERSQGQRRRAVDYEADAERRFAAQRDDQDEAGEDRSGDAPERIERVRRSDIGGTGGVPRSGEVGQEREAETHPDRWDEHDRTDRDAQQEQAGAGAELQVPEDRDDVERQGGEEQEEQRGAGARDPLR